MKLPQINGLFLSFVLVWQSSLVLAFETDQYNLPPVPLADIGEEVSDYVEENVTKAVEKLNVEIAAHLACLETNSRKSNCGAVEKERAKLAELRSEAAIVREVFRPLGGGFPPFTRSGSWVESHEFKSQPARYKTSYKNSIFRFVPTNYLTISDTVRIYGEEFGTDKIAHFFQQGYTYYQIYERARRKGSSEREAALQAARWGRHTENTYYGTLVSGVFSNADLASNYAGMKFYQNLTRPVKLGKRLLPPVLRLAGGFWTISGNAVFRKFLLRPFISAHFNEAWNPSILQNFFWLRATARRIIEKNACRQWRQRHAELSAADFAARTQESKLWHGEDYGYKDSKNFLTIAGICFDARNSDSVTE